METLHASIPAQSCWGRAVLFRTPAPPVEGPASPQGHHLTRRKKKNHQCINFPASTTQIGALPWAANGCSSPTRLQSKSPWNCFWLFSINLRVVQDFTTLQKSRVFKEAICEIHTGLHRLETRFLKPFQNKEHNERLRVGNFYIYIWSMS